MTRRLISRRIDRALQPFKTLNKSYSPRDGWVAAIRAALGLTETELARRMNVSQARVNKLESAETEDAITLRSLRKAAHAMDCELVYALVPKEGSVEDIFVKRAIDVAKKRTQTVKRIMVHEKRELSKETLKNAYQDILDELLHGPTRNVWKD